MRIKKRILPIRKQGNVLIHTGKDPDLSPMCSSQLLSISSYGDADMLRRGFYANKIRRPLFGFFSFVVSHQPLNTGVLSWNRMRCYTSVLSIVCWGAKRTFRLFSFRPPNSNHLWRKALLLKAFYSPAILKLILRFVLFSKRFQRTILDRIHVGTCWINRRERLTAIVLNESTCIRDGDKLWCQVTLRFTISPFFLWCGPFRKMPYWRMFTRPHSRMCTTMVIPFWLCFNLPLGCETWTAVLNQWRVTMHGIDLLLSVSISMRRTTANPPYPHPPVFCRSCRTPFDAKTCMNTVLISLWTAWILCIQLSLGLHEY